LKNLGEWDVLRVLQRLLVGAVLFEFSFGDGDFAFTKLLELLYRAWLGSIVVFQRLVAADGIAADDQVEPVFIFSRVLFKGEALEIRIRILGKGGERCA